MFSGVEDMGDICILGSKIYQVKRGLRKITRIKGDIVYFGY